VKIQVSIMSATGGWTPVGKLSPDMMPGSMTSTEGVLLFGWVDGVGPYVWKTNGPSLASNRERIVSTQGLELLHDLTTGPYELDRETEPKQVRMETVE